QPRTNGPGPGTGQLQEGGRARAFGVAGVQREPIAHVQVDARPRVQPLKRVDSAARSSETVLDRVADPVPASGDGDDHARSADRQVAENGQRILRVDADRVLGVGETGIDDDRLFARLQERPGRHVLSRYDDARLEPCWLYRCESVASVPGSPRPILTKALEKRAGLASRYPSSSSWVSDAV